MSWGREGLDALVGRVAAWRAVEASHVSINTMGSGFASVDDHLKALTSTAEALGVGR